MRSLKLVLLSLLCIIIAVPAAAQSETLAITVYNEGAALIRESRTLTLEAGLNQIEMSDIPAAIDPSSVSIRAADASSLRVIEQSYKANLADRDALFAHFAGEVIAVTALDGTVYSGELLLGRGNDLILRGNDGGIVMPNINDARDIQFPDLPENLLTQPALQWLLESESGGEQSVELTYLTGGMNWRADYNLLLNADESAFDLGGWVTLSNRSGAAYRDARLKLVAGDVQRAEPQMRAMAVSMEMASDLAGRGGGGVEQRDFFAYQLYEIERPVDIDDKASKQIEFVSGAGIAATTLNIVDHSPDFGGYFSAIDYPEDYGERGGAVKSWLVFETGADGLEADLPAGLMRVYKSDIDGAGLLIGESRINHTPQGDEVRLLLGSAFELAGERVQTDYRAISRDVAQESIEARLRNRSDEAATIVVRERLYRWSDWDIIESSAPYDTIDAATIEFVVELAAGEEMTLSYTVQYAFPRNR